MPFGVYFNGPRELGNRHDTVFFTGISLAGGRPSPSPASTRRGASRRGSRRPAVCMAPLPRDPHRQHEGRARAHTPRRRDAATAASLTEGGLDLDDVGLLRVLTGPHGVHGFHSEDVLLARGQAVHHKPGGHDGPGCQSRPSLCGNDPRSVPGTFHRDGRNLISPSASRVRDLCPLHFLHWSPRLNRRVRG